VRRALLTLAVLLAAWLAACGFLFVWPREDSAESVDAIVVLAGDAAHRIPRGRELVRGGVASTLVLSREPSEKWARWRPLCRQPTVVCFDADPYSTRGEAEVVARLTERRGWRSLAVVTSSYHIFRARLLFERCVSGRVEAVGTGYDRRWLPLILPLETVKLLRSVLVQRRC
jgi:DUF218 domain